MLWRYRDQLCSCLLRADEGKPGSIFKHQNMTFNTPNFASGTLLTQINNTEIKSEIGMDHGLLPLGSVNMTTVFWRLRNSSSRKAACLGPAVFMLENTWNCYRQWGYQSSLSGEVQLLYISVAWNKQILGNLFGDAYTQRDSTGVPMTKETQVFTWTICFGIHFSCSFQDLVSNFILLKELTAFNNRLKRKWKKDEIKTNIKNVFHEITSGKQWQLVTSLFLHWLFSLL